MIDWKIGDHVKYCLSGMKDGVSEGEAIIIDQNEEKICVGYKWYPKEKVEILKILYRPKWAK